MIQAVLRTPSPAGCDHDELRRATITIASLAEVFSGTAAPGRTAGPNLVPIFGQDGRELHQALTVLTENSPPCLVRTARGTHYWLTPGLTGNNTVQVTIEQVPSDSEALVARVNELAAITHRQRQDLKSAKSLIDVQQDRLNCCTAQASEDFEELSWLRTLAGNLELNDSGNSTGMVAESVLPALRRLMRAAHVFYIQDVPIDQHSDEELPLFWQSGVREIDRHVPLAIPRLVSGASSDRPIVRNHCHERLGEQDVRGLNSFVLVPVATRTTRIGWLMAINKETHRAPAGAAGAASPEASRRGDLEFGTFEASLMSATAVFLAAHNRNCGLFREKAVLLKGVIRSLVNAIDAKDSYTCGHSDRVAEYARAIASQMGLSDSLCEQVYMTGLLHDIGKIGVPDEVLNKPDKLTAAEFELVKQHPVIGYEILKHLQNLDYVLPGVLHHHEEVDGSGYPHGLRGDEIPLSARILAVADSFDAMTSSRPYRPGMRTGRAQEILQAGAGTQWDPCCLQAFFSVLPELPPSE